MGPAEVLGFAPWVEFGIVGMGWPLALYMYLSKEKLRDTQQDKYVNLLVQTVQQGDGFLNVLREIKDLVRPRS